jgi:hypothetical protein
MKPFPRLLRYFGRYRGRALLALAGMGIVSIATVALLFLLKKVVDEVLGAGASASLPGVAAAGSARLAPLLRWLESVYTALVGWAVSAGIDPRFAIPLLLLAALVVKNVFAYLSELALTAIGLAMVRDLRHDAYRAPPAVDPVLLDSLGRPDEPASSDGTSRLPSAAPGRLRPGLPDDGPGLALRLSLNLRLAVGVPRRAAGRHPDHRQLPQARRTGLGAGTHRRDGRDLENAARPSTQQDLRDGGIRGERFRDANLRYFSEPPSIRLAALNSPLMEIRGWACPWCSCAAGELAGQMTVGGLLSFLSATDM